MRVRSSTNQARRCASAWAAYRSSRVSTYADVSVPTWMQNRTIARRCSTKFAGVRHPVALEVRPVRVLRIGPPVVAFGEEVVRAARAARRLRGGHRHGGFAEEGVGEREDTRPLEGGEVERR